MVDSVKVSWKDALWTPVRVELGKLYHCLHASAKLSQLPKISHAVSAFLFLVSHIILVEFHLWVVV